MKPDRTANALNKAFPPFSEEEKARMLARIERRLAEPQPEAEKAPQPVEPPVELPVPQPAPRKRSSWKVGLPLILLAALVLLVLWMALMTRPGGPSPGEVPPSELPLEAGQEEEGQDR